MKGKYKMKYPKNECIDVKAFGALILDYEYQEDREYNFPAYVSCRVLVEDLWQADIVAETREDAIKKFRSGTWKAA